MKSFIFGIIVFAFSVNVIAQDRPPVHFTSIPVLTDDPAIKGLKWDHWRTKNFSVNSIDPGQGEFLANNIESMKKWSLERWGLPDIAFSKECRIFCVPNKDMLMTLFKLSAPRVEVERLTKDKKEISTFWIVFDENPERSVLPYVSVVSLTEFSLTEGKLPFWFIRGASFLNRDPDSLRTAFYDLPKFQDYNSKLFSTKENEFKALNQGQRNEFDTVAAVFCLFLRKEFGQKNLVAVLQQGGAQRAFSDYYGFNQVNLIESFKRYQKDLHNGIVTSSTPDHYLMVKPIKAL